MEEQYPPRRMRPIAGFRAKGGPVAKNKAYVVGEKGPEVFVPEEKGKVIAHAKLGKVAEKMKQNRKKKPAKGNPFYP